MKKFCILGVLVGVLWGDPASAEFLVIVNKSNPVQSLSRERLIQIYQGSIPFWPADKKKIIPVEASDATPLAEEFSRKILGMEIGIKQQMWINKILSGKGTPPVQFKDEERIVSFVASEPGAIGYVEPRFLDDSVKAIAVDGKEKL